MRATGRAFGRESGSNGSFVQPPPSTSASTVASAAISATLRADGRGETTQPHLMITSFPRWTSPLARSVTT